VELRCVANGIAVNEQCGDSLYRIWMAGLWQCPGCGHSLVTGYGRDPVAHGYGDVDAERWSECGRAVTVYGSLEERPLLR
jgi:ribosomal protein L37AE/L43A